MPPHRHSDATDLPLTSPLPGGERECAVLRAFVGIVIKLADDAGRAGFRGVQMIAAVAIAAEPPGLAQFVERAGDFAAVIAADALDDVGIKHRRRGERLLDVLITRRPFEDFGGAAGERNLAVAAERV